MKDQRELYSKYPRLFKFNDAIIRFCTNVPNPIPTTYGVVITCIYITFSYIKYTHFDFKNEKYDKDYAKEWNEEWFLIFMYGFGIVYFIGIIVKAKKTRFTLLTKKCSNIHVAHIGILILFAGVLAHFILEFAKELEKNNQDNGEYSKTEKLASICFGILFSVIQTYVIIKQPSFAIRNKNILQKCGTIHVVVTNIIVWIQTLLEETVYSLCNCSEIETTIGIIYYVLMFVYPFVIEFVLIGASVFLILFIKSGEDIGNEEKVSFNRERRRPTLDNILANKDNSKSLKGVLAGSVVLTINLISLGLFHTPDLLKEYPKGNGPNKTISLQSINVNGKETLDEVLFFSTSLFNDIVEIIACIVGLIKIHDLKNEPWKRNIITNRSSFDLDVILLRFGSFFAFMHAIVTLITGSLVGADDFIYTHGHLHRAIGVVDIIQITLQVLFLKQLKQKDLTTDHKNGKPGRQMALFLFFTNIAEWIVLTFMIQKQVATDIEKELFGTMACIILKRIILPFAIYFRFHSAWLSIELWQQIYNEKERKENVDLSPISEVSINSDFYISDHYL